MTTLQQIQNIANQGIDVPNWAMRTLPLDPSQSLANPTASLVHSDSNIARGLGGSMMPSGQIVQPYQDRWVPMNERINPVFIEPEQYSAQSYTYFNTAFNSRTQPTPKIASSSHRFATIPVNYSRGDYNDLNPQSGFFR